MQRLLPPILVFLLGLTAAALHFVLGLATAPTAFRLTGVAIAVTGLTMSIRGSQQFAHVGTNIDTFNKPDLLVSDGLFRWTRNPMYLGFVTLLAGLALSLGSWVGVMAPGIFFLVADRWYIPFEERLMRQTFQNQYEDYTQQVRRWVGRRVVR